MREKYLNFDGGPPSVKHTLLHYNSNASKVFSIPIKAGLVHGEEI